MSRRNRNSNFDLFPSGQYAAQYSLKVLGSGKERQFPVSLMIPRGNNNGLQSTGLLRYDLPLVGILNVCLTYDIFSL